jgi:serine/threonine protein kinase
MEALGLRQPSLPKEIGPYEVVRRIGLGVTATVYECRHKVLRRTAAVKIVHPHLARDQVAAARFLREGRAISRIVHPNVVEVFDVGEHDGSPYLVMSFVDGEDLADHARRLQPMSIPQIADCLLPVIAAIKAAHDVGIIHRDLKPKNIRLSHDRRGDPVPRVLDFGISKMSEDHLTADLTNSGDVLGTASYMAPEQLRSSRRVDVQCDVYALGVILYECATGKVPFEGECVYDVMHAVLTAPLIPPSQLRPEIPDAFEVLIRRALERDAARRFSSASELGRALAPFASNPVHWFEEFAPQASGDAGAAALKTEPIEQRVTLTSRSNASAERPSVSPGPARESVGVSNEPMVRGSLIRTARETAIRMWGECRIEEIAERISPDARQEVTAPLIITAPWLPERFVMEWYRAVLEGPCRQDRALYYVYLGRWMDNCFGRVRRLVLNILGVADLLKRSPELWRHDHTTGEVQAEFEKEQECTLTLSRHIYTTTPLSRDSIAEIFRHIVSRSRVWSVTESHAMDGDQNLLVHVRWT